MMGWAKRIQDAMRAGGDFVFPPACVLCQRSLLSSDEFFCAQCLAPLQQMLDAPRCQRCSAPVGPNLNSVSGCIHCRSDSYRFQNLYSLGPYADSLREACLRVKQSGGGPLAYRLTSLLCDALADPFRDLNVDCVIPVPHHWTDRVLQAHHPPDTIADRLSRFLMVPVRRHILRKIKRTPKQALLSPSARRQNLRKAFRVDVPHLLQGRHVLLVDDILTTGTTANRVTHELLDAGAERVSVVVLARAIGT